MGRGSTDGTTLNEKYDDDDAHYVISTMLELTQFMYVVHVAIGLIYVYNHVFIFIMSI